MQYFLTSSPFIDREPQLNAANGFVEALLAATPSPCEGLFICSDPDTPAATDGFARAVREAFEDAGMRFSSYSVLDGRNADDAAALVDAADLIVLAGGHVPTQNAFFTSVGLRGLMESFDGVVVGISAGTMNSADTVYAQPELDGEAIDPNYQRFLTGLALTQTMVLPHYQITKDFMLDGMRLFEDVTYPDSMGRKFVALPDGSYLHGHDGIEEICGEAYVIGEGWLRQVSTVNKRVKTTAATLHALESNPARPEGDGGHAMLERMNTGAHEHLATWGLEFLELPAGAQMLDVGCGGGANMLRLLERCPSGHVTGIDYAPTSVEASRKTCAAEIAAGRCDVQHGNVNALEFDDNTYDAITAFETVYFWPEIVQAFREVLRVLKPDGTFFICNDDDGTNPTSHEFATTIEGMSVYTKEQLADLLEEAGFEDIETFHQEEEQLIVVMGRKPL